MELIPRDDDEITFGTPPLSIEPLNMDFDGDTSAIYLNHDIDALKQMYDHAFIQNTVFYDAKDDCLSTIRHEALYAAYILTHGFEEFEGKLFKNIDDLQNLPEDLDLFNDSLNAAVSVNGTKYTYGVCLFNKWCGFNNVLINQPVTKKQIQLTSKTIYENCGCDSKKYYDQLFELERTLMSLITLTKHIPSLSLFEMVSLVNDDNHELINRIPSGNAYLSYHINNALTDRCVEDFPHESSLYKLFKSGSRFSKVQLARSCINIGLLADENNVVDPVPINSSLITGLTPEQFFQSAPGTRKGLNQSF